LRWFNVQRQGSTSYGQWDGGKKQKFDGGKKLRKGPGIVTQHFPKPFWDTQVSLEFEEGVATLSSNLRFRKLLKYATWQPVTGLESETLRHFGKHNGFRVEHSTFLKFGLWKVTHYHKKNYVPDDYCTILFNLSHNT
jgi:hypothetical protein